MEGTIKTFLPEKGYGFIRGEDEKDYYFQTRDFHEPDELSGICEAAWVSFEQKATPKGYRAARCKLINPSDAATYELPSYVLLSKQPAVQGWEIMEFSSWQIVGSSSDSPDGAKAALMARAGSAGANAVIGMQYFKTTGSEPGTGRGTHYFTIHNYCGQAVWVAKRSAKGIWRQEDMYGLNDRAENLKNILVQKTKESRRKRNYIWLVLAVLSVLAFKALPGFIFVALILAFWAHFQVEDYGWWLQKLS